VTQCNSFCELQSAALRALSAKAVSQLVLTEPGFPVDLFGATEMHAAFQRRKSHIASLN